MNYLFGFFIWWIIFLVICLSVYCFEWQTKNFVSTFRKYAQMILYMLFMLSGYIMAFLASYIWSWKQWKGSALAGALILLITWKIAYKIFGWIWRERNVDTGVIEYNIELSDGERHWCNSISIGGMIVIGIILFAQTGEEDYFEVISMAFSIWMGSYISIQKVQQKNTIKEVLRDWKTVFEVRSKLVPITGTIFMFVLVCFIALNYFEQARMIFDEMIIGFAIGSISFLLGIVIKNKYQKNSRFEANK